MFAEAIEAILQDHCTPAAVRAIEAGGSPYHLWFAVADAGFLELLGSEDHGGAGLALAELFPVLTMLGRFGMPAPLAQSIAARGLLGDTTEIPVGMITMAPSIRHAGDGKIVCQLAPYGAIADYVLAEDNGALCLLAAEEAQRSLTGVHGDLAATLTWAAGAQASRFPARAGSFAAFGAALHAALLAGAMQRVFDMTLQYANDRSQFGKSIGKFQAIQHQISVMAEHVAAASIAAEAAFQGDGAAPSLLAGAIAKSRASEAAVLVASIAHAVHGAIGVTEEYDLQLYTRRLHEWRMVHGSEDYWNPLIGRTLLAGETATIADFIRSAYA